MAACWQWTFGRRNAASERCHRQLRFGHVRWRWRWRTLRSGAGRNTAVLDDLRRRFGQRLVPVRLSGNGAADTDTMKHAAPGPIDAVLDFLPPSVSAGVARAAIMTLRQGGRAVLMGGVGMLGGEELSLPYPWLMRNLITVRGQWMYDTAAIPAS